jgi:hypothetical protein
VSKQSSSAHDGAKPRSGIDESGYRQLVKLFTLISADNGGCTADEVEAMLAYVSDADLETLAMGEHYDQLRVKRALGNKFDESAVEALDQLLNVAFQGPLKPSDFSPEDHASSSGERPS